MSEIYTSCEDCSHTAMVALGLAALFTLTALACASAAFIGVRALVRLAG